MEYKLHIDLENEWNQNWGSSPQKGVILPPKPLVTGGEGAGGKGVNIFEIYIQNEAYIPSFSFLAPKLGVQPSKGGNFTPKTPRYGGEGVNIFEIYIQNEAYMQSFSFLAPKLWVGTPPPLYEEFLWNHPLLTVTFFMHIELIMH